MNTRKLTLATLIGVAAVFICGLIAFQPRQASALSTVSAPRNQQITNGDFSDGTNGWWSTASVTMDASSGELVAAITGNGANPWDAIVGQHNVEVQSGVAYTISFDARASEAATVQLVWQEDGGDFAFYGGGDVALTTASQQFVFTAVGSADNSAATFQFQMGGVGDITAYIDNVSVEGAVAEPVGDPLQNGSFDGLDPWFTTPSITPITGNGTLSATITTGGSNPWDVIVGQHGVPIIDGQHYVLIFDAYASEAKTVKLLWQENGGSFAGYFAADVSLDTDWQTFAYRIGGSATDPAASFQFQMGGLGEFDFFLRNVSLVLADPAPTEIGDVIENGTFEGDGAPWWTSDTVVEGAVEGNGTFKAAVINGGANRFDAIMGQHGVPIYAGMPYTLTFTAWASEAKTIDSLWQLNAPPWTRYHDDLLDLTTTPQTFSYTFIGSADNAFGSFQFHLGGNESFDFYVRNVSLRGPVPTLAEEVQPLHLNQTGYFPEAPKIATIQLDATEATTWTLRNAARDAMMTGQTTVFGYDNASGAHVHQADFSGFQTVGTGFTLEIDGYVSHPFAIGNRIYEDLQYEALAYFYHNRSGIELTMPYAGEVQWTRPAGHIDVAPNQGDGAVPCFAGTDLLNNTFTGCDYTLDLTGGWYDAGDHGKYVVNGGISVWTLMNLYERALYLPDADVDDFADSSMNIPENSNGVPDLLDEARWQMEFMLKMQVPDGGIVEGQDMSGMVHHKMADVAWTGLGLRPDQDPQVRVVYPPSTAATLNMAATAAQCARLFAAYDAVFAQDCLDSAEIAWTAALANPAVYAENNFTGSGPYDDEEVSDEFYWAAVELYLSTGKQVYFDYLTSSEHYLSAGPEMWWREVAPLGTVSLAIVPTPAARDNAMQAAARDNITAQADLFLAKIDTEGYRLPYSGLEAPRGDATVQQVLTNGDFSDGTTDWWTTSTVTLSESGGTATAQVTAGGANPWDAILGHHNVPIVAGNTYTVALTASSDTPVTIKLAWQEDGGSFTSYLGADLALTTTPQTFVFTTTAAATDPAGTFQFQMGGVGEFTAMFSDVRVTFNEYDIGNRKGDYDWGSNSSLVNNSIILALAHEFQLGRDLKYLNAVSEAMDYLMGHNPMDQSYVTGYGERSLMNPHHRFWAKQLNDAFPGPPPGVMSGGPNSSVQDPVASAIRGCAPATCFLDNIDSWSTNEITINWNAPFAWVVTFLNDNAEFQDELAVGLDSAESQTPTNSTQTIVFVVTLLGSLTAAAAVVTRRSSQSK